MKHYLFTRFNLKIANTPNKNSSLTYINNSKLRRLSSKWIENRLDLLETYTVPSILAQTNKNFEWWILVHRYTPKKYITRLQEIANIHLTDKLDFEAAQELTEQRCDEPWVISSNCDSDDCLAVSYVDKVQNAFRNRVEFIDFGVGYRIDRREDSPTFNAFISTRSKTCTPFRSLVEETKNMRSLYYVTHGQSEYYKKIRRIKEKRGMWAQIIHGDNLANRMKPTSGDGFRSAESVWKDFGLGGKFEDVNPNNSKGKWKPLEKEVK